MNLQVLVSVMNKVNNDFIKEMNISTDAIVINQCDKNFFETFEYRGKIIKKFYFQERGVGLSRNNALMRADADICLFADEDVEYVDNYGKIVLDEFEKHLDADIILFNVPSKNPLRPTYIIPKFERIRVYKSLRYGAVKIAIRLNKVREKNIYFSLLFGGGSKYGSGEDSLFLFSCIRNGLKVYANPQVIGYVSQKKSTWFSGYDEKYFIDKGALYYALSGFCRFIARLLCLQDVFRHRCLYKNYSLYKIFRLMNKGIDKMK